MCRPFIQHQKEAAALFQRCVAPLGLAVTIIVGLSLGIDSNPYVFLFDNIVVACGTTMYSMLAFYLGSVVPGIFDRNAEAALLLLAAILVMMGSAY